jgi:TetR/AcrR family transcriptional regulator, cholesterol catabolism regulator
MPRELTTGSRQDILQTSARLFREHGYDATSMNDISAALNLSKGGLYHHFRSKDEILFHIMNHAMDITEERVLVPIRDITDPETRLRTLIRLHIQLVLRARDREITVILHENHPLPPGLRKRVNARKKEYIHYLEQLILEVQRVRKSKNVSHRAAAFALLGMVNWIYQWYRPEGALNEDELIRQYTEIFFAGAFQ